MVWSAINVRREEVKSVHVHCLQIVVEQRQLRPGVDQVRVGLAGMVEVVDDSCQQRRHFVHLVENTLQRSPHALSQIKRYTHRSSAYVVT